MKYQTLRHSKRMFIQYDNESTSPMVIYHFSDKTYSNVVDRITILEQPEYFILPYFIDEKKENFSANYVLNCSCLEGLQKAKLVCPECDIKFANNNYCDIELVLSKGKSLYGVIEKGSIMPFNEPYGCLYVLDENLQRENYKEYSVDKFSKKANISVRKINYGFGSAPQFDSNSRVKIDRSVVYNRQTNDFEETENYNENNIQNVFPDIEDELTK